MGTWFCGQFLKVKQKEKKKKKPIHHPTIATQYFCRTVFLQVCVHVCVCVLCVVYMKWNQTDYVLV